MITVNTRVRIVSSEELSEMKLSELVGRTGFITEDLAYPSRKNRGYMVLLDEPFMRAWLWFIPEKSVCYED